MHGIGASGGFSSELKFVVDGALGMRIREWARHHLAADPHGGGPSGDEYTVSSLYFDTAARDVFHRRGSYGRSKYRIRRYGESPGVFLERKLRTGSRLAKWRTTLDLASLPALAVPSDLAVDSTTWFRRRVTVRQLRPVCQVTYRRTARMGDTADGPARLTIDDAIAAVATGAFSFDTRPTVPLLDGTVIVELKYRGAVPAVFRRLVTSFALEPQRSSKYRAAAEALGLASAPPLEGESLPIHA
jgi:hypothetical protein